MRTTLAALVACVCCYTATATEPPASPEPTGAAAVQATDLDALLAGDSPLASGQTIVFFGDSITQAGGYIRILRDRLAADRPDLDITLVNRGHSGYRVPNIQPLLQTEVLDMQPALVVIYIGINDVWQKARGGGTPRSEFEDGLYDMVERCHDAGVRVVLASPSIIGEFPRGSNPLDHHLDDYAAISRSVATETGATFCDLRAAFFDHLSEHKTDRSDRGVLTTDGVHMTPAGDALLIETMAAPIRDALAKPASPFETRTADNNLQMVYIVHHNTPDEDDTGFAYTPGAVEQPLRPALIVLPGGDGSAEFKHWVGNIASNAPPDWLTVQLVAPVWRVGLNRIVWPTAGLPDKLAEFTTDTFIDAVAREIQQRDGVDPARTYLLGWSSGGPPVYSAVMSPDAPVAGAVVLMSVFKPEVLPDPEGAAGRHVFILHSKTDFIPERFAQQALDTLAPFAAGVRLEHYTGAHGWNADLLERTARAFRWLDAEATTVPSDPSPP